MASKNIHCRLCKANIVDQEERINIFDRKENVNRATNISDIIMQHYEIVVKDEASYSTCICLLCWSVTDNFHRLFELVKQSEEIFLSSYYGDDNFEDDKLEIIPYCSNRTTNIVVIEGTSENIKQEEHNNESDCSSIKSDLGSSADHDSRQVKEFKPINIVNRKQRNEKFEQENQQIRDFFSMNCEMCDIEFRTVNEASLHYKQKHNKAGYLTCCGKKFFRRCIALEHIQQHLNPNQLKCELCDKSYSTPYLLRQHMIGHEMGAETTDFSCEACMESFVNKMQLSQHMRRKHLISEEKKFGCDICGKFFVTKRVLTTHIRGVHENAFAQMCHVCARTFKSKHVYQQHLRDHLDTELPKLQCNICGAWLKNERGLQLHLTRHSEPKAQCEICNKQTPNRHALGMHMRYVHSEAKHKCNICEKSFKKPIGLKEHMASHTGVDLYACPYCSKTFKSGANMHSHRKKEHFEQWTQDRHQRYIPRLL